MVGSVLHEKHDATAAPATLQPAEPAEINVNVPLAASENERARALVNLDENFVTDVAGMNPSVLGQRTVCVAKSRRIYGYACDLAP